MEVTSSFRTGFGGKQQIRFEASNEINMYTNSSGTASSGLLLQYKGGETNIGKGALLIKHGGDVHIGNKAYSSGGYYHSSDRKLKKNISTIKSPLEKVSQLRGVDFN
jgi:hypothetical protein